MFSERTRYIFRLLTYLGKKNLSIFQTVEELSEETDIPRPYLGKIVGFLADENYLETRKGPAGGVSLADEPENIAIDDLMEDIEEFEHSNNLDDTCCLSKEFSECYIDNTIDRFRETVLDGVTLEDAVDEIN